MTLETVSKKMIDYCTLWPDRFIDYDLSGCCCMHDMDYESGMKTRLEADQDLRFCVKQVAGPAMANLMYAGVRLVGWYFWSRARNNNNGNT